MAQWYLVVFLVTTTCHSAFTLALDPCDQDCILGRLADLEIKQSCNLLINRASDAENHELREKIAQQQSTIESQASRIETLEKAVKVLQEVTPSKQQAAATQLAQHHTHDPETDGAHDNIGATKTNVADDNNVRSWPRRRVGSNKDTSRVTPTKRQGLQENGNNAKLEVRIARGKVDGPVVFELSRVDCIFTLVYGMNVFGVDVQKRSGIAFSSYLDHDVEVSNHQTVKFNKVVTNEGNGYNNHTGVFTCPEGGMYLLTFVMAERDVRQQWTRMVINSVNLVDAVADTWHVGQDTQGGNTVIVRLRVGDAVWVESTGAHVEGVTNSIDRLTTFSGVFLYH